MQRPVLRHQGILVAHVRCRCSSRPACYRLLTKDQAPCETRIDEASAGGAGWMAYLLLSAKQTTNDSVPICVREPVAPLTSAHSRVPETPPLTVLSTL